MRPVFFVAVAAIVLSSCLTRQGREARRQKLQAEGPAASQIVEARPSPKDRAKERFPGPEVEMPASPARKWDPEAYEDMGQKVRELREACAEEADFSETYAKLCETVHKFGDDAMVDYFLSGAPHHFIHTVLARETAAGRIQLPADAPPLEQGAIGVPSTAHGEKTEGGGENIHTWHDPTGLSTPLDLSAIYKYWAGISPERLFRGDNFAYTVLGIGALVVAGGLGAIELKGTYDLLKGAIKGRHYGAAGLYAIWGVYLALALVEHFGAILHDPKSSKTYFGLGQTFVIAGVISWGIGYAARQGLLTEMRRATVDAPDVKIPDNLQEKNLIRHHTKVAKVAEEFAEANETLLKGKNVYSSIKDQIHGVDTEIKVGNWQMIAAVGFVAVGGVLMGIQHLDLAGSGKAEGQGKILSAVRKLLLRAAESPVFGGRRMAEGGPAVGITP